MRWRAERVLDRLYRASEGSVSISSVLGSDGELYRIGRGRSDSLGHDSPVVLEGEVNSAAAAADDRLVQVVETMEEARREAEAVALEYVLGQSLFEEIKRRIDDDQPHLVTVSNDGFQAALESINESTHVYGDDVDYYRNRNVSAVADNIIQWLNEANKYNEYQKE